MPRTIPDKITINGHGYTTYASVAEADIYLMVDLARKDVWTTLEAERKELLLVAATQRLNMLRYIGAKVSVDQPDEWPRSNIPDIAENELPFALKNATSVLAATLQTNAGASNAVDTLANYKNVRAGPAGVEFFRPLLNAPLQDTTAFVLLRNAGLLEGGDLAGGFAGGTDVAPFPLGPLPISDA